jgi:hypothetical protein
MSSPPENPALGVPERRFQSRRSVQPLAHVNVGPTRGVLSDISECGLGVQAANSEIQAHVSTVAFRLPGSQDLVKIKGQIVWLSESRREGGIKFLDASVAVRGRIQEWISRESSSSPFEDERTINRALLLADPKTYHIREVRFDADLNRVVKSWTESHRQFPGHTLHCDPEWLAQRFKHEKENVRIFLLEKKDEVMGVVTFVHSGEPLVCALGEFVLAKLPMRILRLQGYTLNMPEEEAAYDSLFQALKSDFDAIYMENVNTNSFLWNYLRSSMIIRQGFRFYTKRGELPHFLIRLDGTFEGYIKKFSAQTRKNRLREIRRLRERGQVNLLRVSRPSEIDTFFGAAYEISQRTWKFKSFGWGLAARDADIVTSELRFWAEHGWLRSYVLKCDGIPCSFILGHQYGSSFYADFVGVDDAWRSYSVGTVILLLVIEDLFNENSPKFYDFGTYVKFQEYFATESYPEMSAWLFRRGAYPTLASNIYCACNAVSTSIGRGLDHFGLKSKLKKVLWNRQQRSSLE